MSKAEKVCLVLFIITNNAEPGDNVGSAIALVLSSLCAVLFVNLPFTQGKTP